ncbi:hypothetical protein FGO68_gene7457 [Halteria grandinella]|uniref:Uncharacterized protein n=1 Tax=Halteria grandinella TaxID=5974 RepID=A0A8J8NE31_HALGN|nr:hypothetical protein FGO68_gene7457 [Halteria grandinella]
MAVALSIISPITQIASKLMMFQSKFKVNAKTLEELLGILKELKVKVETIWEHENFKSKKMAMLESFQFDMDYQRVLRAMNQKINESIKQVEGYQNMNAFMRLLRVEHIRREIHLMQAQIMKMSTEINQFEINRSLQEMKARQSLTDMEIRGLVGANQQQVLPMLLQIQQQLRDMNEQILQLQNGQKGDFDTCSMMSGSTSLFDSQHQRMPPLRRSISSNQSTIKSQQASDLFNFSTAQSLKMPLITMRSQSPSFTISEAPRVPWHKIRQDKLERQKQRTSQQRLQFEENKRQKESIRAMLRLPPIVPKESKVLRQMEEDIPKEHKNPDISYSSDENEESKENPQLNQSSPIMRAKKVLLNRSKSCEKRGNETVPYEDGFMVSFKPQQKQNISGNKVVPVMIQPISKQQVDLDDSLEM